MRSLEKQTHAKEAGRRGRVATCICVYCSVFSNPNRAECESRAAGPVPWFYGTSRVMCGGGSESMGHLLGRRPIIQGA